MIDNREINQFVQWVIGGYNLHAAVWAIDENNGVRYGEKKFNKTQYLAIARTIIK